MLRFECDYNEGCCPEILKKLEETNLCQTPGYGEDEYCEKARQTIKKLCRREDADVHFLVGGTQANLTVVAAALRPYQGAISASTGHINCHETGAVEGTGHKVLTLPSSDGKITAQQIEAYDEAHWNDVTHEHIVQPGMVYISNPTENGTLYSKAELTAISRVCRSRGLWLFMDGARLGYGLMSTANDLTLPDIADLCDVFYIGGTKVGLLFGEAVVITADALKKDFRYMMKHQGSLLAKGRLLGIQFEAALADGLYFRVSKQADELAMRIREAFAAKGIAFLYDSYTNQQFPILPDETLAKLAEKYAYSYWTRIDDTHSAVRFCTSWATKPEAVDELVRDIGAVL